MIIEEESVLDKSIANRNSSLELLRIISMILIIMHHYSVHGAFDIINHRLTINTVIIQILSLGGKLGVNCFVLITGYFMVASKFKLQKLIKLIFQIVFYSVVTCIIFFAFGLSPFSLKTAIKSILPINGYWFATTYIVMYIWVPYINIFIKSLSKKRHLEVIVLSIFLWCVIPTFLNRELCYSEFAWFVSLYLIASYFKLYPNDNSLKCKMNMIYAIVIYILVIISVIVFDLIGLKINFVLEHATYFMSGNKLPIFLCSITLFLAFKNLKLKPTKSINTVAMTTFGIYLIHDNQFVRPFIWENIFRNAAYIDSPLLILHASIAIMLVFTICSIIDFLRIILIERPFFSKLDKKLG